MYMASCNHTPARHQGHKDVAQPGEPRELCNNKITLYTNNDNHNATPSQRAHLLTQCPRAIYHTKSNDILYDCAVDPVCSTRRCLCAARASHLGTATRSAKVFPIALRAVYMYHTSSPGSSSSMSAHFFELALKSVICVACAHQIILTCHNTSIYDALDTMIIWFCAEMIRENKLNTRSFSLAGNCAPA